MKNQMLLLITFLSFASCNIQKNLTNEDHTIVYIVPSSVEELLAKRIKKEDKVFFHLMSRNDEYSIYYSVYDKNMSCYSWISNSNRKILIAGSFYPLIFNLDEIFATTESPDQIVKDYSLEKYPMFKKTNIVFDGFYINFNLKGDILKTP
jgi:hypothetical protein